MGKTFNMVGGGGGGIRPVSISVSEPPAKTAYKAGETFDPAGMVVLVTYSNGATLQATGYSYDRSPLAVGATSVTITYTESGTTMTAEQAVTVTKTDVAVPTQSGALTYNGAEQTASFAGYDASVMAVSGDTAARNAGDYTAVFALLDPDRYQWSDGTTADKSVAWSIARATPTLTASPTALTLDPNNLTASSAIATDGDGTLSVESDNEDVVTAAIDGSTVTASSVGQASGSAVVTVTLSQGTNYLGASATITVTAQFVSIYGVEWDGSSTTVLSRTDAAAGFTDPVPATSASGMGSSPFDNLMPWAGMVKSERTGGTMVSIPKFWYKLTQNGTALKIQIADGAQDGFSVSPAHMDRGDGKGERDVVYIGRYHCGATAYKSATGQTPKVSITRSTARSSISNLGSTIWQTDWAMRFTLWLLCIVEFANWNSQATIGGGCSQTTSSSSAVFTNGTTDGMVYHTGNVQGSHSAYGVCQYRWIEGLWDNCRDWMDGCYYSSSGMSIILNPADFSDSSGGTVIGTPAGNGYISALAVKDVAGAFPCFISSAVSGSASTYVPDYWGFSASYPCLLSGGYYGQNAACGLFYVDYNGASYTSAYFGCRLQELP